MLNLHALTKTYQSEGRKVEALCGVDLALEKGDFVQIIGRSGSGKTTLLSLVAGLLRPDAGHIQFEGQALETLDSETLARLRNQRMGIIPQQSTLLMALTLLDNVVLPYYLYTQEGDGYGRALYLLDRLGIRALAEAYPHQLSGGEQRRVLIARALINQPALLLADEPTSDLDPESSAQVMALLSELHQEGLSLLMITHELDTLSYGDRLFRMEGGRLEALPHGR